MRAGLWARIAAATGLVALATWAGSGLSLAERTHVRQGSPSAAQPEATTPEAMAVAQSARRKTRHRRGKPARRRASRTPPERVVLDPIEAARAEAGRSACRVLLAGKPIEVSEAPAYEFPPCVIAGPVRVLSIGSDKVQVKPAALVDCRVADALIDWIDKVVQPAAIEELGSPVKAISSASGFVCRPRNSQIGMPLSEHSFGKAIDISGFELADGRRVTVLGDWYQPPPADPNGKESADNKDKDLAGKSKDDKGRERSGKKETAADAAKSGTRGSGAARVKPRKDGAEAESAKAAGRTSEAQKSNSKKSQSKKAESQKAEPKKAGEKEPDAKAGVKDAVKTEDPKSAEEAKPHPDQFLRKVHAGACGLFSTVLGPEANAFHRDHFHLDLRHRRGKDICE
ncbi:MAG: extensin family protein [Hyphomicrobiaceae bacterium]